jgi:hypothetical protein
MVQPSSAKLQCTLLCVLQVLHCAVPPGHTAELVVDPGPGVLLVVAGSGKALVRAAAVTDELTLDEADLHPGDALVLGLYTTQLHAYGTHRAQVLWAGLFKTPGQPLWQWAQL